MENIQGVYDDSDRHLEEVKEISFDTAELAQRVGSVLATVDRSLWTQEDYVYRIKRITTDTVCDLCILFKEIKDKFFSDPHRDESWTAFCKNELGLSRQTVYSYLRIGQYILPKLPKETIDGLGVAKLELIAKLRDTDHLDDVLSVVNPDMTFREVKEIVDERRAIDRDMQVADGRMPEKRKRSIVSMSKAMQKLDADLKMYWPFDDHEENAKRKMVEIADALYHDASSLKSNLEYILSFTTDKF